MDFEKNTMNPEKTPLVSPDDKMENPDNKEEKLNQEIDKEINEGLKISKECENMIDEMGGENGVEEKFNSCSPEQKTSMLSRLKNKINDLSAVISLPVLTAIGAEGLFQFVSRVGGDASAGSIGHVVSIVLTIGVTFAVIKDYQANQLKSQSI